MGGACERGCTIHQRSYNHCPCMCHISADNQSTTEVAHNEGWKGVLQSQLPDEAHAVDSDIIVIRGQDLCDMTAGDLGGT